MHGRYRRDPWRTRLGRLLDPMLDALKLTGASKTDAGLVIKVVLRHMQRRGCSFWKWTESDWGDIVHNTIAGFERRNIVSARSRPYLMAVCLLLGRISDLRHLGNFDRAGLALKVFGPAVELSIKRIADTLTAWGYSSDLSRPKERTSLCEVFLLNRSPLLEDISAELLSDLHRTRRSEARRWTLQRISNALSALKLIDAPIQHGFEKARGGQTKGRQDGCIRCVAEHRGTMARHVDTFSEGTLGSLLPDHESRSMGDRNPPRTGIARTCGRGIQPPHTLLRYAG